MSEIPVSPVRLDTHTLLAKAGGVLRAHLTQEERERLARLLVAAVWQKNPKPDPSTTAILQLLQRHLAEWSTHSRQSGAHDPVLSAGRFKRVLGLDSNPKPRPVRDP